MNRHKDQAIKTNITCQSGDFAGTIKVFEVNGPDIKSTNDFGVENVKTLTSPDLKPKDNMVTYSFPAHSLTMLRSRID